MPAGPVRTDRPSTRGPAWTPAWAAGRDRRFPARCITGTVAERESWTHLHFPETGDYVFPAGLATVHIDGDRDVGEYWEPNTWIVYPPAAGDSRR